MTAPVPSLSARSVAVELVLVASTRSSRLAVSYWARVTRTVSAVGGGGGGGPPPAPQGEIVSCAVLVMPSAVAVSVTVRVADTEEMTLAKNEVDAGSLTWTLAGTWTAGSLLDSDTVTGSALTLDRLTVAFSLSTAPPAHTPSAAPSARVSEASGSPAATLIVALLLAPAKVAVIVTGVVVVTVCVWTTNAAWVPLMVAVAGTEATAGLLLVSATVAPSPEPVVSSAKPSALRPPPTFAGSETLLNAAVPWTVSVAVLLTEPSVAVIVTGVSVVGVPPVMVKSP